MISIKDDNTPLVAAFEDEITQEANSDYKLSFKYPAKHEYRPLIKKGIILEADDLHGTQLFRVLRLLSDMAISMFMVIRSPMI